MESESLEGHGMLVIEPDAEMIQEADIPASFARERAENNLHAAVGVLVVVAVLVLIVQRRPILRFLDRIAFAAGLDWRPFRDRWNRYPEKPPESGPKNH